MKLIFFYIEWGNFIFNSLRIVLRSAPWYSCLTFFFSCILNWLLPFYRAFSWNLLSLCRWAHLLYLYSLNFRWLMLSFRRNRCNSCLWRWGLRDVFLCTFLFLDRRTMFHFFSSSFTNLFYSFTNFAILLLFSASCHPFFHRYLIFLFFFFCHSLFLCLRARNNFLFLIRRTFIFLRNSLLLMFIISFSSCRWIPPVRPLKRWW